MIVLSSHLRCFLFFCLLIQFASLYTIDRSDDNHSDLTSSSLNDEDSDSNEYNFRSKRSMSAIGMRKLAPRRNNSGHWNPLVAAYKRCSELIPRQERESCFKNAVQMLFVHKL